MTISLRLLQLFLLCAAASLAGGCTSGPYRSKVDPDSPEVAGRRIVFLDKDLVRTLAVDEHPIVRRNDDGTLTIQAGVRNRRNDENLQIQIQTLFRNNQGFVLYSQPGSEAAWETLSLTPNQLAYYKQTSLTPAAADYTIRIRYLARPELQED